MAAELITTNAELRAAIAGVQNAFVPTMGALHEGHGSLIRLAASYASDVVVSIFVNPTQFGPDEDFNRYPRTLEADIVAAEQAGATVIYAPSAEMIYPPNAPADVPELPRAATEPGLEDAHRPGHFAGVCQVVARLFDIVQPRWAVFGEKDYQQLLVIREMVERENKPDDESARGRWPELEIVSLPTVREADGLAMSSRNRYLSLADRDRALGLKRALDAAVAARGPKEAEEAMRRVLIEHELNIDYAVVRDNATLLPVDAGHCDCRALIAARLGDVRLIDNCAILFPDEGRRDV